MKKAYLAIAEDDNTVASIGIERYPYMSFVKCYTLEEAQEYCARLHEEWETVKTKIKEIDDL